MIIDQLAFRYLKMITLLYYSIIIFNFRLVKFGPKPDEFNAGILDNKISIKCAPVYR